MSTKYFKVEQGYVEKGRYKGLYKIQIKSAGKNVADFWGLSEEEAHNNLNRDGNYKIVGLHRKGKCVFMARLKSQKENPKDYFDVPMRYKPLTKATVKFTKCGHMGPEKAELNFHGRITQFDVGETNNVNGQKTVDDCECPRCYFNNTKRQVIRCCLCGIGIEPGNGVILVDGRLHERFRKEFATMIGDKSISCLRFACCPGAESHPLGYWTGEGFELNKHLAKRNK
ncbi:MAG TPA: hypothetical protein P5056_01615 [Candidatus Paceibacterota bacterium]|nr:hypothetical protein [Candidatus Paceibacterota bacterium]